VNRVKTTTSSRALVLVFSAGMLYLALSFDWRTHRRVAPRVELAYRSSGEIQVGAARVALEPPLPTVVAGYPPPRSTAISSEPLFARALALQVGGRSVAIASAEVLEIPPSVAGKVRERGRAAGLSDVVVTATHPHTSFGGYDKNPLVQYAATGWYDGAQERLLTEGLSAAVAGAWSARRPATLRAAQTALAGVSRNRAHPGTSPDQALTALFADALDGSRIATLFAFGCHPTLADRHGDRLDGDWPSRAMQRLESQGGVALFVQGALGDATSTPPEGAGSRLDRMGGKVAEAVAEALGGAEPVEAEMGLSSIEIALPPAEADSVVPGPLRRPAANLLSLIAPSSAEATVLTLGRTAWLFMPAEPTAAGASALREKARGLLPAQAKVALVSLAQGYVGYLETPEAMAQGQGEARRTLFGSALQERIGEGLVRGLEALRQSAVAPATAPAPTSEPRP
jgi:hypothetical protein